MGIASRIFLLDRDDRLYRLPEATLGRMLQHPGSHLITCFAGARVRMAHLFVELSDRHPIRIVWSTFGVLTFNEEGRLDPDTFERQQWALAEQALAPLAIKSGGKSSVVNAQSRFVAQGGRWTPSRTLSRRIDDAALERATYTRLAASRPTRTLAGR